MNIHIQHAIEFEKIKDWKEAIPLTRKRMSIQQLLDSRESDDLLITQLDNYICRFDSTLDMLIKSRHVPLDSIPLFSWNVNGCQINSSCWKTDAIMARLTLAELLLNQGTQQLPDYKVAAATFARAKAMHEQIIQHLNTWKWKHPDNNQFFLETDWHKAVISHLECLRHLAMLSVGIDQTLPNTTLYTVAQRAVQSAAESIASWPGVQPTLLPLCETLRYYYSANILWERGEYGPSIYTMQLWCYQQEEHRFDTIHTELDKITFLLAERQRTNNGAYFDAVVAPNALPTPSELRGTNDIKHPSL